MAEQIRARIRRSRGGRKRAAPTPVFATLGSFGRDAIDSREPSPAAAAERPARDPLEVVRGVFGIVQGLFLARIVFALISLGRGVPVATVVLALSDPLVEPFRIAVHVDPAPAAVPLLDVPALLALIVWTLVETVCLATICVREQRRSVGEAAPTSRPRALGWATNLAKTR